jgi:tetratricopeptide (TPR) repeat protein
MNIVIDGVIFQIQAGRPHGISRMWRSLISELQTALPGNSITVLRRCGSELPIQGWEEYTIPPYCFGPNEILEADDQMLTKVCGELEADIFLSTYYTRALGVPNALFMYDMIPEIMKYNLSEPQWSSKQRAIANAEAFLTISESTGRDLTRFYGVSTERISVAHLGVAADFRPASRPEVAAWMKRAQIVRPYFLLVGNRGLYKNGVAALQALTRLQNSRDFDIIAVGGEPRLTPEEAKIARDLNLRIIPWLSDEELRLAYAGSWALLYPSLYEGFGLPVAEAMACGCPVITMRTSSLPEVGGEAPIYVSPDSLEEFAAALVRVQDASERTRMASAGIEQARLFNWKQTAQRVGRAITASARKGQRQAKQSEPTAGPATLVSAVFPLGGLETPAAVAELNWLRDQTVRGDLELIVVGNEQEIRALREADGPRGYLELPLQLDETILSGCNRALRQARGRYLTVGNRFLGFARNAFEAQVRSLEERPEIGLVFSMLDSNEPNFGELVQILSQGIFCSHAIWRKEVHKRAGYFNPALSYEARHEFYLRVAWSCGFAKVEDKPMHRYSPEQNHQSERIAPDLQNELSRSLYSIRRLVPITALYPGLRNYGADPGAWSAAWLDFGNRCARTRVPDFPLAIAAYQTALRSNGLSPEASAALHQKVGNNVGLVLLLTNRIAEGQSFLNQSATLPTAARNKEILHRNQGAASLDPFSFEWAQSDHPVVLPGVRSQDNPRQAHSKEQMAAEQRVQAQSQSEAQVRSGVLLVSAIVSTYNSEKFIRGCLQDLVGQTLYQKGLLEIIVVDSGSPQDEQAIVREFQSRHKNIRYLRTEERETIYAAWNRAIDVAQGQYITNANTDDAHRPDALERLAAALEKFPQADLAYGDYLCTSVPNDRFADTSGTGRGRQPIVQPPFHPALAMFFCPIGCHPFWRRNVFERIGKFDSAFTSAGDYEFLLRFVNAGLSAVHVPETLSLFYQNRDGIQFRKGSKSLEELKSIYAKYRFETPIDRLFKVRRGDRRSEGAAWIALGNLAMCHDVPWFNGPRSDLPYALFCYTKASEVDPENVTAIANQAIVALCQNEIEKANHLLKRLPGAELERIRSLSDPKQLSRLVPVEVAPANPTLEFVGSCHADVAESISSASERNALDKTRLALEKAAGLEPENADLAESLGVVQFRLGDFAQARESLIRVTAARSADPSAFFQLAVANLRLERLDDFEAALGRAMEIDPRHAAALKLLADIHFECGKFQEAAQAYGRIVRQEPENIAALLRLGICFHKSGDLETAKTVFEKVLELQPENAAARENLEAVRRGKPDSGLSPEISAQFEPLVSAIVSTYNSERFLRGCLQDLTDQSLYQKGQLEIVVVDSGSEQNERSIVKEFQNRFKNIVYVRTEERERIYAAWNRGLHLARGKYVTNANTDDRHRADALEVMMLELERHPEVALVYADQLVTRRENQQFGACPPDGCFKWPEFDRMQLLHTPCCGPQPMWRRRLHDELGLFDGSLKVAGDYEWWLRVSSKYPFKHIPEFLGLYLLNAAGVEHGNSKEGNEETHRIRAHYAGPAGVTKLDYKRYPPSFLVLYPESGTSPTAAQLAAQSKRTPSVSPSLVPNEALIPILWIAPIYDPSGYADEARHFIINLEKQGFPLAALSIARASESFRNQIDRATRENLDRLLAKKIAPPFLTLVHGPGYTFDHLEETPYCIGRTMFETDRLPAEWVERCNRMDEIWVPTGMAVECFRNCGVKTRLVKIPGGVDTQRYRPGLQPLPIAGVRGTVFLSIFEWMYRKGWDVLLQAWAKAFRADDNVSLVLRTYPIDATETQSTKAEIERRIDSYLEGTLGLKRHQVAPIIVLGNQISEPDMPRLYASAHAYVAPSRGEGWGRPQMQAMAAGLPVIATGWGGTREFMTDQNSLPIDYSMVEVNDRCEVPFYRGHRWAEPSVEHLASLLRRVVEQPKAMGELAERALQDLVQHWQWDKAVALAAKRLQEINSELKQASSGGTPTDASALVKLAIKHLALDEIAEFETALARALELDPYHREALQLLADLNFQNGQWRDAGEAYRKILTRLPNDVAALNGLGLSLFRGDELEIAATVFERSLELEPDNKVAKENLDLIRQGPPDTKTSPSRIEATPVDGFRVSAIVSAYNAEEFMRGCLQDLVGQSLYRKGQLEIIVIDSGSQQSEGLIVREFQQRYENIVYQRTERESLYAAWNRAARLAQGKYLTPANTDDRHRPDALELMANVLDEKRAGLAYADVLLTSGANETFDQNSARMVWELPEYSFRQALMHCPFGSKDMWRRDLHHEIGYFDPGFTIAGDYEFFLRVVRKHGAVHIADTLGLYYESQKNLSYTDQNKVVEEVNRFLGKFRTAVSLEAIYPFLRDDKKPLARAAALIDWANQLAWASVYPGFEQAEEIYREASLLLGSQNAGVQNNLALLCQRQGRLQEALQLLESIARVDAAARHNLAEIQSGNPNPQLRLFALAYPALEDLPPVIPSLGRRISIAEYRSKHGPEAARHPELGQSQTQEHDLVTREALELVRRGIGRAENRTSNIQHPTSNVEPSALPASNPGPMTSDPAVMPLLAKADAEHQKGNLGRAQQFLREASKIAPNDSQIRASLGAVSFSLGDFESARLEFQRLVQLRPEDPSAFVQLALASLRLERIEEFESALARALEVDPHYREALKILADLNFQHGSLKDAAQTYSKILSRNPNDIEALHPLGVCFFKTGDLDTARSVFERVLAVDPDNSLAKENLEAIRRKTQEGASKVQGQAPNIEHRTVSLDQDANPSATPVSSAPPVRHDQKTTMERVNELIDQANFFNEVGNREAALESLEQAAELAPRDAELLVSVGSLHFTLGNYEAARGHFRRVIELQPRDPEAYTRLGMVCMKLNRIEEMESALGIALELDPDNREALKFLAKTNLENNRVRDAGRLYAKLLDKKPDDVESLLSLGLCFFRGSDRDSARMVYERVLELDPFNSTARENLIQLGHKVEQPSLSLTGAPTESTEKTQKLKEWLVKADIAFGNQDLSIARDALKAALELAPDTPDILSALGTLCYQLGDLEQARTYLRQLVQQGPDNAGDWARLALTFYHLNEIGEFEAALGRALELDPNHVEALRMLGHLNFNHGSIADAAQQYGKLLKQAPDDVEVITALGVCFYKMRDYESAQMMFERVLELNPENALAKDNLHAVKLKLHPPEPVKPAGEMKSAGAKQTAHVDKLLNEAQTLITAGNLQKACAALRRAAELAPNDADIFATLGSYLYQLGDCPSSQEALARAVELRPDSADFQTRLAVTLLTQSKISEFESALSRALELDSDHVPALRLLADLNLQQGKYRDAADTYFRILRKDPDTVDVILAMGVCFYKTGDITAARLMYERALKLQPQNEVARENLEVIVNRGREVSGATEAPDSLKILLAPAAGDAKSILSAAESEESFRATQARTPGTAALGSAEHSIKEESLVQPQSQPASGTLHVVWEGSQFVHHSLALINRELCLRLLGMGHDLSILPFEADQFGPEADPRFKQLASRFRAPLSREPQVHVRHQWPLNFTAPPQGYWVVIQPWEFGSLPKDWLNLFRDQVDEIWVPSSFVRQCYIQSGVPADKVFVVPNGIDPVKFHPGARAMVLATRKKFKFLFVGGTIHRKGPDLLLQAYVQRFRAADDVCLVIKDFGGETVYQGQTLQAKVREIQSNSNAPEILYLTQDLPPDSLPGLYTACDCLVHPYRGEGFGLPILEAMACGLPVITTAGGASDDFASDEFAHRIPAARKNIGHKIGNMELVGEGWLLEPDLASLSDRIASVFRNPEAARALGRKAAEHARTKWTWELAAKKAEERLRILAARTGAPIRTLAPQKPKAPKTELPPIATLASLKKVHDLLNRKKHLKAWNAALEVIALRPFHPDAYLQMVEIALAAEDERQAFLCAERLLHLTPNWDMARKIHSAMKALKKGKRSKIKWTPLPVLPAKPRLSVCLIVKNEERFIGQCLASVKPVASQIVVVDTGSTDRTVEIAKECGAEVHHFAWNDNFSDARNAAHEHARGDWVLILDADEEMPLESHLKLAQDMAAENILGYRIPICNLHEAPDSVTYVPRLFRNAPAFFFVGRVHEQIYASVTARTAEWGMEAKMGTATIIHHGYDPEVIKQRGKVQRNLRLMARAVEEIPDEAALLMNYGLDLVNDGRLDEGYEKYRHAVRVLEKAPADAVLPEVRERLVTIFGSHLVKGGRMAELFEVMTSKLARDSGPTASMHFLAGLALMKQKRFSEGVEQYRACLAKRHLPMLTPPCAGVMTAGPHHLLAECLIGVGQKEEAEKEFAAALEQDPKGGGIIHDYAYFLHAQNRSLEALQLLHGAITKDINEERIWQLGGYISNSKPDFLEFALDWTAEALKFHPEHNAINGFRGESLLKAGRLDEALPFLERKDQASTPTGQAAIIMCQLATRESISLVVPPDQDAVLSREFLGWYRRLLATNAKEAIQAVNARLDLLKQKLPTAAAVLKEALKNSKPS